MDNFGDSKISEYCDLLASRKSVPGGGSALGLVLEIAASLTLMVINFTIDKKGYENCFEEMQNLRQEVMKIKQEAHCIIDDDGKAYRKVMDAYKSQDVIKINEASIFGCEVPYRLYKLSEKLESICQIVKEKGNKNLVSDAMIALDLIKTIYPGSILNIKCNIDGILDLENQKKYRELLK